MSIALPFLAVLIAGMFAAYHRLRLAVWAAISATLLVACWLLGAHPMATIIAGVLVALIALPLLVPQLRKPLITRWNPARSVSRASCSPASPIGSSC